MTTPLDCYTIEKTEQCFKPQAWKFDGPSQSWARCLVWCDPDILKYLFPHR